MEFLIAHWLDIVTTILQPGQTITPSDFISQVNARNREIKQHVRDDALLNQAIRLNLIEPSTDGTFTTTSNKQASDKPGQPCRDSVAAPNPTSLNPSNLNESVNNSLTLPPHPSSPSSQSSQSSPSTPSIQL